jgi:hypothetical protein
MIIAPDPAEVSVATPILAWVSQQLLTRPYYLAGEPFAVDFTIYERAEREMREVLKVRGWNAPGVSADLAQRNFLLLGTPIVLEQ